MTLRSTQSAPRRSRTASRWLWGIAVVLAVCAGLFLLLVSGFATRIAQTTPSDPPTTADGIVVLTGGPSRIADAVRLLEQGRGDRLLISGVYPSTTSTEIAATLEANEALFDCCIDLDYRAQNTFGNAREARDWAKRNGYRSLIVVTNDYHMPRTLVELGKTLPDVELRPFPVDSGLAEPSRWFSDPGAMRVLSGEFVKYTLSLVNLRLGRSIDESQSAAATGT
ncbi:MAG: YdcF family protein [Pseudomonadota bacterium]